MKDIKSEIRTDRGTKHETLTKAKYYAGFSMFRWTVRRSKFPAYG